MSDTPVVGKIAFSSVANPNTWDIGESKCLVFASPSEAKRAEELFSAMQRDLTAAQAKLDEFDRLTQCYRLERLYLENGDLRRRLSEVEADRNALKEDAERLINLLNDALLSYHEVTNNEWRKRAHAALDAARKK